jgi:hypothetical protein
MFDIKAWDDLEAVEIKQNMELPKAKVRRCVIVVSL